MKSALSLLFLLIFVVSARAEDRMFSDLNIYGDLYGVDAQELSQLRQALTSVLERNQLPLRLTNLKLSEVFKLFELEPRQFVSESVAALSERLDLKVSFWLEKIGRNSLSEFITNTTHDNPYHLLLVHESRFNAYLDFLLSAGIIDSQPESERGLSKILSYHYWAEGVDTSRKTTEAEWERWKVLFSNSDLSPLVLRNLFNEDYFKDDINSDFFQRIFVHLSKDLLEVLEQYPQYISAEFLIDVLIPQGKQISLSYDLVEEALSFLNDRGLDQSTGKKVLLSLVRLVIENTRAVLNDRDRIEAFIEALILNSSSSLTCSGALN